MRHFKKTLNIGALVLSMTLVACAGRQKGSSDHYVVQSIRTDLQFCLSKNSFQMKDRTYIQEFMVDIHKKGRVQRVKIHPEKNLSSDRCLDQKISALKFGETPKDRQLRFALKYEIGNFRPFLQILPR